MPIRLDTIRRHRLLAAFAAFLFAAFALAATAPHGHGCAAVSASEEHVLRAPSVEVGCPLCEWAAAPSLSAPTLRLVVSPQFAADTPQTPLVAPLFTLLSIRLCPRAPPL